MGLVGSSITLLPLTAEHVDSLWAVSQDAKIWPHMPTNVTSREVMQSLVDSALERVGWGLDQAFVVFSHEQQKIVGSTRYLDISSANRHLEIGWTWLAPTVWRTAVNTECKYLLLRHAFEELQMIRVQFKADERNERSKSAILRLGATYEGTLRHHRIMPDGYLRNSVYYSILAAEWPAVKQQLESRLA